jgi:hypothetical protein
MPGQLSRVRGSGYAKDRRSALTGSSLGHAHIATTRLYHRRKHRPEDSPTFKVVY